MNEAQPVLIVMTVYLGIIVFLLYGPWQELMIEMARQRLFDLRDQVFDLADAGEVEFESKGYRETRSAFNAMIRFCHDTTWPHLLLASRAITRSEYSLADVSAALPQPLRGEINNKFKAASNTLVLLLWARSPLLLALTAVLAVFIVPVLLIALLLHGKPLLSVFIRRIDLVRNRVQTEAIIEAY